MIDAALKKAVQTKHPDDLKAAQRLLKLDELNFIYFFSLYEKYSLAQKRPVIRLLDESASVVAYPIDQAPIAMQKQTPLVQYSDIQKPELLKTAQSACLWLRKLQAGTGSTISRMSHMARVLKLPQDKIHIGSKGTDLFINWQNGKTISIAELVLLQIIQQNSEILFQDIVSSETSRAIESLWNKPFVDDPKSTYKAIFSKSKTLKKLDAVVQMHVPTIDEKGSISFNRTAPAGHALFAVDALRLARNAQLPKTKGPAILAIGNGEDTSSLPDAYILGWMIQNKIPIAVMTTDKTQVDKKGGLLCLVNDKNTGEVYTKILETAEAKAAGQGTDFENTPGLLNTNLALFNMEVLKDKLNQIPDGDFLSIVTPDLIQNWKEQVDTDGVKRRYLQLEGAMGSTIMNLDRYYRREFKEGLAHVVNVNKAQRTRFFSPVKNAFDFFMQFFSDRFQFDKTDMRLRDQTQNELPLIQLADPFYSDVENVLQAFKNTKIRNLTELSIKGVIDCSDMSLEGCVKLQNLSGKPISLKTVLNDKTLKDCDLTL